MPTMECLQSDNQKMKAAIDTIGIRSAIKPIIWHGASPSRRAATPRLMRASRSSSKTNVPRAVSAAAYREPSTGRDFSFARLRGVYQSLSC